jgi:hypothetical protein
MPDRHLHLISSDTCGMCFRPRYSETAAFTPAFVRWRAELPSGRRQRIPAAPHD